MSKPTSIRLSESVDTQLDSRTGKGDFSRTEVINESLDRYYYLLARARKLLLQRELFSPAELSLMADSCNGTLFQAWSAAMLVANVEDSISLDGLDDKWSVDGAALIEKLNSLDLASTFALVDAIEQFWRKTGEGQAIELANLLNF